MENIKKLSVLIIDDEAIALFISTKVIELSGVAGEVLTAQSAKEALEMLSGGCSPDVILIDINMPVKNGFEFVEAFKELKIGRRENMKLVMLSSSINPNDFRRAAELGVETYLSKPLTLEKIEVILNAL